ncbi:KH domain-containing protein [Bacillaceae bacterium SIJ1]|uniref:KH domain-containing protein n=1 Tax=Litoribacterium kuwaitense TaxID=1398745 RepID=UPI0013EAFE49|nr:KH domain-containing protein [Litoribacterium kuwaitense]NGP44150.1 KH domain-containing protein [Litoribacterium kuwaitense]
MIHFIQTVVKPIVDYPEAVEVIHRKDRRGDVYALIVHPEDKGKVIGKNGRVAKAIRSVVYAYASKHPQKVYLDIQ